MVDIKTIKEFYHRHFEDALLEEMAQVGTLHTFEEHDLLIDFQQKITTMPLLLEGAIKIMREDFDEGELLLYYLEKGDTCAMTMACCMGDKKSDIRAIAETNGVMLLVPVQKMSEWMAKYSS